MSNSQEKLDLEDNYEIAPECSTLDFTRETWKDDVTFLVEDKRLYASKAVLALFSPVFETMFGTDFKEKTDKEVLLPGKKAEDFLQFLKCLYPVSTETVTRENVFQVLPLADEYQVEPLLEKCRNVFLETLSDGENGYNTSDTLRCYYSAKRYNIPKIDKICIQNIIDKNNVVDMSSKATNAMGKVGLIEFWMDISTEQEKRLNEVTTQLVMMSLKTSNLDITGFENGMGAIIEHTIPNVFDPDLKYGVNTKPVRLLNATFMANLSVNSKETRGQSEMYLSVYLRCHLPDDKWLCETNAVFVLENVFAAKNKIIGTASFSVNFDSEKTTSYGFRTLERLSKFLTDTPEKVENFTGKLTVYILAKQRVAYVKKSKISQES